MSTRKIHYGGFFTTVCGQNCGYDVDRKSIILKDVTCRRCMQIILTQCRRDLEEIKEEHKKIEYRCKQLFMTPW